MNANVRRRGQMSPGASRREKPAVAAAGGRAGRRGGRADHGATRAGPDRWRAALAVVLAVAWGWRLLYLRRLAGSILDDNLTQDAFTYWHWSAFILRNGPLGHHPFFLGPLYPYLLAGLRAAFGDSVHAILIVQALWGAVAAALLADAARRLTRPAIGLTVGLLAAFHPMAVFFDGLVLMESLLFALECFLLWWVVRAGVEASWRTPAVAGVVVGLLAQGRATSALLLVPVALALAPAVLRGGRRALGRVSVLAVAFGLVCTPAAVRNYAVGREWIPFTYNLGYNLYVGNGPGATGAFWNITAGGGGLDMGAEAGAGGDGRDYLRSARGLSLTPAGSSRWWERAAVEFAAAHPGRTAGLWARKLAMMWNRREYPQIENADVYRRIAGPLGIPGLPGFVLVAGLAGLCFVRRTGRHATLLLGYAAVTTFAIAPFFVTDRYRHHLVPAALLLAAIALHRVWDAVRGGTVRGRIAVATAISLGAVVVTLPMPALSRPRYEWGIAYDLGNGWLRHGRPDLAAREFERALRLESEGGLAGAQFRISSSSLDLQYATALHQLGREAEALPWYQRAVAASPGSALAADALIAAYQRAGRTADARGMIERLGSLADGRGRALVRRGWEAARAGRLAAAESLFTAAVTVDPHLDAAWVDLVKARLATGRLDEARTTLARARRQGVSEPVGRLCEAMIAARAGDRVAARRALDSIPRGVIESDPYLAGLADLVRQLLR